MKGNKCPVCGHSSYFEVEGLYDTEEWGQGRKLTPDQGYCTICGFFYEEYINYPFEEQTVKYKEKVIK